MARTAAATGFWLALTAATVLTGNAAPPQRERTASWYADHPSILEKVTKLCRDDPGHAAHNPDCMNASHAEVLVALREADHRNSGNLTPPSDPQYWKIHPGELPFELAICNRLPPEAQASNWCPAAY